MHVGDSSMCAGQAGGVLLRLPQPCALAVTQRTSCIYWGLAGVWELGRECAPPGLREVLLDKGKPCAQRRAPLHLCTTMLLGGTTHPAHTLIDKAQR